MSASGKLHKLIYRSSKQSLASLLKRHYWSAKIIHKYQDKVDLSRSKIILVYTMGKVGSTSLYKTLAKLSPDQLDANVHHVHYLSHEMLSRAEHHEKQSYRKLRRISHHLLAGRQINKKIKTKPGLKKQLKIITTVRDPVALDISSFFESFYSYRKFDYDRLASLPPADLADKLQALFLKNISGDRWLKWFDRELKSVMGVDVFATEFPKSQGYGIYQGYPPTLVLKLEHMDSCIKRAAREFLGVDGLNLIHANVGEDKPYADAYRKFKKMIRLPQSYLYKMYTSKLVTHFYDSDEIEIFRQKWSGSKESSRN